jgi:HEPN domain-containing protein
MANRAADWLHQARQDLDQAQLSAAHGHHEWACFAAHQAVEKALKGLHLQHGQQVWGHGLGRLFRELPDVVQQSMEDTVPEVS